VLSDTASNLWSLPSGIQSLSGTLWVAYEKIRWSSGQWLAVMGDQLHSSPDGMSWETVSPASLDVVSFAIVE